jgi:hypothetical protein
MSRACQALFAWRDCDGPPQLAKRRRHGRERPERRPIAKASGPGARLRRKKLRPRVRSPWLLAHEVIGCAYELGCRPIAGAAGPARL